MSAQLGSSLGSRLAHAVVSKRGKWVTLAVWAILAAIAFSLAPKLQTVQKNDFASFLPASAEGTKVIAESEQFANPDAVPSIPAVVLYEFPDGVTPQDIAAVEADKKVLQGKKFVLKDPASWAPGQTSPITGPIPSKDGKAVILNVPVKAADGFTIGEDITKIRELVGSQSASSDANPNVYVTGPAGTQGDLLSVFGDINGKLLGAAALVVIVMLLLTYRSPVLWIFPLLAVFVADSSAQAVNYLLAQYAGLTVNGQSASLLLVLVFGAGTDYALLLVSRYREELRRFEDKHHAMAEALHKASPAIIASAATVTIGLLCMTVSVLNSNRGMGPVAAVGIVVALVTMLTLFPALLVAVGRRPFWPLIPSFGSEGREESGLWSRIAGVIGRRPRPIWIVTALVLGAMALGVTSLKAGGIPQSESFKTKPESIIGQEVLAKHYDAGSGSPVVIVANEGEAAAVTKTALDTPGIAGIAAPTQTKDGRALVQVNLSDLPDSFAAQDTVRELRDRVHGVEGADALVGGATAVQIDINDAGVRDAKVVIPLVLVVVLLVLVLLLRSFVAPLLLMATVVLSFAATMGISAWLFEHVFGFAGQDPSFLLFSFIFLVALGIDYNIFLMHRVREESMRLGTRPGILKGLAVTGGVITSAGLVLAGTFAVLGVLPIVFLFQIGFAVAFGVILDTFVVRSILVPALAYDIGPAIWWPSRLGREDAASGANSEPAVVEG